MTELKGKTAFITGGASGAGLAMARRFLMEGMKVAIADINASDLSAAIVQLDAETDRLFSVVCDVSEASSVQNAAQETFAKFGNVHILCNNAGVSRTGWIETVSYDDWDWVLGVNLKGTIHGLHCFLPHMKAHGEGGHIVNTASLGGLIVGKLAGPYSTSKAAVIALSEVLALELEGSGIGVTIVCPGYLKTNMLVNGRNRPARYGGAFDVWSDPYPERTEMGAKGIASGLSPDILAGMVVDAINQNRLYLISHPGRIVDFEKRCHRIVEDAKAVV